MGWLAGGAVARAGWVPGAVADVAAGCPDGRFELEYRAADGIVRREALTACLAGRLEEAQPVRSFHFEKGAASFAGWQWLATTGRHVGFESWLERDLIRTTRRVVVATVSSDRP